MLQHWQRFKSPIQAAWSLKPYLSLPFKLVNLLYCLFSIKAAPPKTIKFFKKYTSANLPLMVLFYSEIFSRFLVLFILRRCLCLSEIYFDLLKSLRLTRAALLWITFSDSANYRFLFFKAFDFSWEL